MVGGKSTGGELWFKAVCLAASVGLHAGLGLIGWQGIAMAPPESAPIMVSLAEGPETLAPQSPRTALPGVAARAARPPERVPPPRSSQSPAPGEVAVRVSEAVPVEVLQCALDETAVGETEGSFAEPEPVAGSGVGNDGIGAVEAGSPDSGFSTGPVDGGGDDSGVLAGRLVQAKPRYASNPKPEYPRLARLNHWEGVVTLRAAISAAGEVESVVVESSSGYPLLDRSAVGGVRRWRFVPARRGDLRVPCEVRIPVAFQLDR